MKMVRPLLAALAAVTLLIACGGSDDGAASTTTMPVVTTLPPVTTTAATTTTASTTTTTTTTTTLPPAPLNGLPTEDPTLLNRRVVAVKIDNHPNARPQSGLQEVDAAYELLVEGGLTRFIGLFHTTDSNYVGPIRSVRPTDPTLVDFLGAPLQISGGQDWVISIVNSYGVKLLGEGSSTFRIRSRKAPHNLYGDTTKMRQRADERGWPDTPPDPWFTFSADAATEPTDTATTITFDWSDWPAVVWQYEDGHYLRFNGSTPHEWVDAEGNRGQVAFDTIVVIVADRYTARPSGKGTPVPALDTVGSGTAYAFSQGGVVTGTWSRDDTEQPFTIVTDAGDPLVLPPGRPIVVIFPSNRTLTWE